MKIERELIIQKNEEGYDIALLENKHLVEFHKEEKSKSIQIGDIYWARIKRLILPLNAAFVDIGEGKEAFLHFTDLSENFPTLLKYFTQLIQNPHLKIEDFKFEPPLEKEQTIDSILDKNVLLPVKVLKEPISTKGARLTAELSLAGRFLVLIPFENTISVSKKIDNKEERKRLIEICQKIKPTNFGIIIRTVAEGVNIKEIHQDILQLKSRWDQLVKTAAKSTSVAKLMQEEDTSFKLLRDMLNDSFTNIMVNDQELAENIKEYIATIAPEKEKIVKIKKTSIPLFEELGLMGKIKSAFNKTVLLPSGGYLVIERTEAMHVIDVNSGIQTFKKLGNEGDETILKLNTEAAIEIARQIRLRDLGGIISIDFIDSKNPEVRKKIYEVMTEAMEPDKANHTILPLSKFCVMQITRSRVKPEVQVKNTENCPSCKGTGKISSSIVWADHILNRLQSIENVADVKTLEVHPYIYAFLKIGIWSKINKFRWQQKKWYNLKVNTNLDINEYHFYDKNNEKIII